MRRVQPTFLLSKLSEILKHVCQQQRVCSHVQIVVVAQRPTAECIPNFFCVRVVFVRYAVTCQARIKVFFLAAVWFR